MLVTQDNLNTLAWDKMDNLIPVVVQHAESGKILMQGYMNPQAATRHWKVQR